MGPCSRDFFVTLLVLQFMSAWILVSKTSTFLLEYFLCQVLSTQDGVG